VSIPSRPRLPPKLRRMNTRLFVPLLVVGALVFACAPRPNTEAAATASPTAKTMTKKRSRAKMDGRIISTFVVKREAETVRFVMRHTNAGEKPMELTFPSGQTHDVAVVDANGKQLWRWSKDRMFTQSVQTKALSGGESIEFEEQWPANAAHGKLTAVATLSSANFPVSQRSDFELP
jgi:hypothetical protein